MAEEGGIYRTIEKRLRDAGQPLTCNDLFDMPDVRQYARHVNKISDTLGNMWRRGYLTRLPAPQEKGSQVKYAYTWKRTGDKAPKSPPAAVGTPGKARNWGKPRITVDENTGTVSIELGTLIVEVRPK